VADAGNASSQQISFVETLLSQRVDELIVATDSQDDEPVGFCIRGGLPVILVKRSEARDVFRAFAGNTHPIAAGGGRFGWPKIELGDADKTMTITAELPGMTERDVQVEIANGVLTIGGEKQAERNGSLLRTCLIAAAGYPPRPCKVGFDLPPEKMDRVKLLLAPSRSG
jgi:HSP20 family molecular chaperone IbpA